MVSTQRNSLECDRRGYASALLLKNTLEEITLPLHVWDELEWKLFFAALAEKSALRKVTIEVFFIDPVFMREVSDSIEEGNVEDKVFFRDMRFNDPTDIFEVAPIKFEGNRLSEAYIELPFETGSGRLSRILCVLPSCGPVTSLELPSDLYDLNDALLSALGNYWLNHNTEDIPRDHRKLLHWLNHNTEDILHEHRKLQQSDATV